MIYNWHELKDNMYRVEGIGHIYRMDFIPLVIIFDTPDILGIDCQTPSLIDELILKKDQYQTTIQLQLVKYILVVSILIVL